MTIRSLMLFTPVFFLLVFLSACAQGSNPTVPPAPGPLWPDRPAVQTSSNTFREGHNLLGYYQITIDSNSLTGVAVPFRETEMHLNVLSWLEVSPCATCLKITNVEVEPNKNLLVDIQLRHPFTDPMLTGFDVRGIAMFAGGHDFPAFGLKVSDILEDNPTLENADGFTTLYNPTTAGNGIQGYIKGKLAPGFASPTATLNGFKTYYSNENRRYYSAGATLTSTFHIVKPPQVSVFTFGYAIDASWAKPSTPVTVPDSFPQTANCLEAYKIATVLSNSLAMTQGAVATLTIDVYDWQGAATISAVAVEGPYFWDGLKTAPPAAGGPGTKRFTCQLSNDFGFVAVGEFPIVIRVLDTSSSPGALIDNIAWQVIMVPVIQNQAPSCAAEVSNPDPDVGEVVTFTDQSTDPQGQSDINESWWDWDNDTVWDEEGLVVTHSWATEGAYTVGHKVVDMSGAECTLNPPVTVDVGTIITLQEDLAMKAIGSKYHYISKDAPYASGSIINVADLDGPWDFTTVSLSSVTNEVDILGRNDPEVASFVDDFNPATTHFVKSIELYDPFFPVLYQAEFHYFPTNQLFVYGFYDPYAIGSSPFGPPDTAESLAIPYPLSMTTDYQFNINQPGFVLTYQVKTIGKGDVTVPYGGGTTYHCLLVRYKFSVTAPEPVNGGTLDFAFVDDSGLVVANVIAVNDPPNLNFTPANSIIGSALFQALNTTG